MKDEEIIKEFISESSGLIQEALEALSNINDGKKDEIDTLFRILHTIKGGAGFAQMEKVKNLTHRFENLLEILRSNGTKLKKTVTGDFKQIFNKYPDLIKNYFVDEQKLNDTLTKMNSEISDVADKLGIKNLADYEPQKEMHKTGNGDHAIPLYEAINEDLLETLGTVEGQFVKAHESGDGYVDVVNNCYKVFEELENATKQSNKEINLLASSLRKNFAFFKNNIDKITDDSKTPALIIKAIDTLESQAKLEMMSVPELKVDIKEILLNLQDLSTSLNVDTDEFTKTSAMDSLAQFNQFQMQEFSVRINPETLHKIEENIGKLKEINGKISQAVSELQKKDKNSPQIKKLILANDELIELEENFAKTKGDITQVPLVALFQRLYILINQVSEKLNKEIRFEKVGDKVQLDKSKIEILKNCLFHLVRNSADHGIETIDERKKAGKPAYGTIYIGAIEEKGKVIIEFKDDGRGIDIDKIKKYLLDNENMKKKDVDKLSHKELLTLIFKPGLSTADEVTELSGRGVGLDAVKHFIKKLDGKISVDSKKGEFTQFVVEIAN